VSFKYVFPALLQNDFYKFLFIPFEEDLKTPTVICQKYRISIYSSFIGSLSVVHLKPDPEISSQLVVALHENHKFYHFHQFLQYFALDDSEHIACTLLSMKDTYPPAFQLALDMFKRLNKLDKIIDILLDSGFVFFKYFDFFPFFFFFKIDSTCCSFSSRQSPTQSTARPLHRRICQTERRVSLYLGDSVLATTRSKQHWLRA
jgi:hypothetical protein